LKLFSLKIVAFRGSSLRSQAHKATNQLSSQDVGGSLQHSRDDSALLHERHQGSDRHSRSAAVGSFSRRCGELKLADLPSKSPNDSLLFPAPQVVSRIVSAHPPQHRLRRTPTPRPRPHENLHENLLRGDGRVGGRPADRARNLQRIPAHLQGLRTMCSM
jgi:hypothetical protein